MLECPLAWSYVGLVQAAAALWVWSPVVLTCQESSVLLPPAFTLCLPFCCGSWALGWEACGVCGDLLVACCGPSLHCPSCLPETYWFIPATQPQGLILSALLSTGITRITGLPYHAWCMCVCVCTRHISAPGNIPQWPFTFFSLFSFSFLNSESLSGTWGFQWAPDVHPSLSSSMGTSTHYRALGSKLGCYMHSKCFADWAIFHSLQQSFKHLKISSVGGCSI